MMSGKEVDSERTIKRYDTNNDKSVAAFHTYAAYDWFGSMVELSGIEPLTSSLRTRRSPN
jgi:hypothetical protein